MNHWLEYAAASTGVYAFVTLLDRYVMGQKVMTPIPYLLIGNIAGILVALGVWIGYPETSRLSLFSAGLGLVVGVFFGIFTYLYFEILRETSPVATAAYMQIVPVIAAVGGIFFLGEHLTEIGLVAILMLSVGLTFVSLLDRERANLAALKMIPATILLGVGYIIQKVLLGQYRVSTLLILNRAGALAFATCLFLWTIRGGKLKSKFWSEWSGPGAVSAVIGEIASLLALYWSLVAYANGPLAEVSAIAALLPVAVLLLAYTMWRTFRMSFWHLPETRSEVRLLLSLIASALIVASVYLIAAKGIIDGPG